MEHFWVFFFFFNFPKIFKLKLCIQFRPVKTWSLKAFEKSSTICQHAIPPVLIAIQSCVYQTGAYAYTTKTYLWTGLTWPRSCLLYGWCRSFTFHCFLSWPKSIHAKGNFSIDTKRGIGSYPNLTVPKRVSLELLNCCKISIHKHSFRIWMAAQLSQACVPFYYWILYNQVFAQPTAVVHLYIYMYTIVSFLIPSSLTSY